MSRALLSRTPLLPYGVVFTCWVCMLRSAFGYMYGHSLECCEDGTEVEVDILGQRRIARVRNLPVKVTEPMRPAA